MSGSQSGIRAAGVSFRLPKTRQFTRKIALDMRTGPCLRGFRAAPLSPAGKVERAAAPNINAMNTGGNRTGRPRRCAVFAHVMAAIMLAAVAMLGIAGCAPTLPTEQELRAALIEQVRADDAEYNRRMDRWGAPKSEIDGSSFSMTRTHRALTSAADIKIRKTKGHTTIFEADVPRVIATTIKTGLTDEECLAAPERNLEPQSVTSKYEWDNVRKTWHEVKFAAPGGLLGM